MATRAAIILALVSALAAYGGSGSDAMGQMSLAVADAPN